MRPEHLPEPTAHGEECLVAGGVAEPIVDGLEPVEVDEQDGQHPVPAVEAAQRLTEPVHEQRPVGQRRERVVQGELGQGFGRLPMGRHVLGGARHPHRPPVDAADPAAALQPADRPAGQQAAMGEVERLQRPQAAVDGGGDQRPVVGVDRRHVALERPGERLGRDPEESIQLVGPPHEVGGNVPLPDPHLGDRLGLAKLIAGRLERRLEVLVLGDVMGHVSIPRRPARVTGWSGPPR